MNLVAHDIRAAAMLIERGFVRHTSTGATTSDGRSTDPLSTVAARFCVLGALRAVAEERHDGDRKRLRACIAALAAAAVKMGMHLPAPGDCPGIAAWQTACLDDAMVLVEVAYVSTGGEIADFMRETADFLDTASA